jgi:class 3 adenylate cyclase
VAIVETLGIADELARDGVFSREQAERLARVSSRVAVDALVTKADLAAETGAIRAEIALLRKDVENLGRTMEASAALLRNEFAAKLQAMAKELVNWFPGILLAHGLAVIGVTVTLVKLL